MSKHFAYLMDDDSSNFFQKLACEEADRDLLPATAPLPLVEKIAAAKGIDKVAARVDRDIQIVKTAGVSGHNFGSIRRGLNYIDGLVQREQFSVESAGTVFDKVASAAIEHDLSIIEHDLRGMVGHEYNEWVDNTVADIGLDLVKAAALDKEALIGVVRAFKATKGLSGASRARAVAKAPGQSFKQWRTEAAVAKRGKAAKKLNRATRKAQTSVLSSAKEMRTARKIKDPAIQRSVMPGIKTQAAKDAAKHQKRIQKASDAHSKRQAKVQQREAIESGRKPAAKPKDTKQLSDKIETAQGKMETGRSQAKDKAADAAKGGKPSKAEPPKTEPGKTKANAGGEKETGMLDSLGKLRDKGWKNLSPAEKNKVLQAGAGAYVAKETLT